MGKIDFATLGSDRIRTIADATITYFNVGNSQLFCNGIVWKNGENAGALWNIISVPKNCVGVRGEGDIGNELNMLGLGVANNVGDCGSGMDGAKVVGEGIDGMVKADLQ